MPRSSKTSSTKASSPASYEIHSLKLIMNDGSTIDIKTLVSEVIINESLFNQSIQVDLKVVDGFDLFQKSHMSGGEKVKIKIRRKDNSKTTSEKIFDLEVYIAEILDHSKPKASIQYYKLICLSSHAFIDRMKKLNRSFTGNINALIRDICKNDLGVKSVDFSNKNLASIKGIYPNLNPLQAVTWLLRNSSDESTPFFFYETINDGLQFNSYKELLETEVYKTYNNTPYYVNEVDTPEYFDEASKKILEMNSELDMSKYQQISNGAYAASTYCIDISNKEYITSKFNRSNNELMQLNKHNSLSNKISFDDSIVSENYASKEFFISTNANSFGTEVNYHGTIKDNLTKKNSYFQNLKFMGLDIVIYGDFDLSPGKIIELTIPKSTDVNILKAEGRDAMKDKLLSGKYVVSSIAHVFDGNEYKCDIGLQKDSLLYDLDSKITIGN